ncbi:PREDICTED: serine/threonine-protein phosphatase 6 regulatory subunit 1-like [Myotis davidii]|uniref:serine/threonine-protein phosphatase 6 regulatory subunit 1-like n=1 Tax=Myotis davidii TaxID=225400 RepID=UPI00076754B6|nr:PREDICTED: serine/threonine-protein phosphatase 6 regulatory subunit 1-like [Myotis davidii]
MAVFVRSLPGLDPAVLQQVVSLGGSTTTQSPPSLLLGEAIPKGGVLGRDVREAGGACLPLCGGGGGGLHPFYYLLFLHSAGGGGQPWDIGRWGRALPVLPAANSAHASFWGRSGGSTDSEDEEEEDEEDGEEDGQGAQDGTGPPSYPSPGPQPPSPSWAAAFDPVPTDTLTGPQDSGEEERHSGPPAPQGPVGVPQDLPSPSPAGPVAPSTLQLRSQDPAPSSAPQEASGGRKVAEPSAPCQALVSVRDLQATLRRTSSTPSPLDSATRDPATSVPALGAPQPPQAMEREKSPEPTGLPQNQSAQALQLPALSLGRELKDPRLARGSGGWGPGQDASPVTFPQGPDNTHETPAPPTGPGQGFGGGPAGVPLQCLEVWGPAQLPSDLDPAPSPAA